MAAGAPPAPSAACAAAAQPPAPVAGPRAGRASARPAGTAGGRWVGVWSRCRAWVWVAACEGSTARRQGVDTLADKAPVAPARSAWGCGRLCGRVSSSCSGKAMPPRGSTCISACPLPRNSQHGCVVSCYIVCCYCCDSSLPVWCCCLAADLPNAEASMMRHLHVLQIVLVSSRALGVSHMRAAQ